MMALLSALVAAVLVTTPVPVPLGWVWHQGPDTAPATAFLLHIQAGCQGTFTRRARLQLSESAYVDSLLPGQTACWDISAVDAQGHITITSNKVRCSVSAKGALACR